MNDLLAGAASSAVGTIVGHPFDLVKTRVQASGIGTIASMSAMLRVEGLTSFFKGLTPALCGYVSAQSIMFVVYGSVLDELAARRSSPANERKRKPTLFEITQAGAAAGSVFALVVVPFELLKVRMQTDAVGRYRSILHCGAEVVKREGVAALSTGLKETVLKEAIAHAIWFSSFHIIKLQLSAWMGRRDGAPSPQSEMHHAASFTAGGIAGALAYLFVHPIDTVKSIVQAEGKGRGAAVVLSELLRTNGPRALFRGVGPVMLQVVPENAALLYVYDLVLHHTLDE